MDGAIETNLSELDTSSHLKDIRRCSNCNVESVQTDSCAAENLLVCMSCGYIMEATKFNIDTQSETQTALSHQNAFETLNTFQRRRLGYFCPSFRRKEKKITAELNRLADKMRLKEHERKHCLEKLPHIISQSWGSYDAIAAGLMYIYGTDQSPLALRKIKSCGNISDKKLRFVIRKIKAVPSLGLQNEILPQKSINEVMTDHIETLGIVTDLDEKMKCIAMCSDVWEILQTTNLEQNVLTCHPVVLAGLIVTVLEHIRKNKSTELIECVSKQCDVQLNTFEQTLELIRCNLFKLAAKIPSLDQLRESKILTIHSIIRYIPTLIDNKHYMFVNKALENKDGKKEAKKTKIKRKDHQSDHDGVPCTPLPYPLEWPEDDTDSLSEFDDDINQYLASADEIEIKKKMCKQSAELS